eukprot:14918-Amphidinium_carterae.2
MSFVQGALKLKRSDLVATGSNLVSYLTYLTRMGSIVQSDVLIVMSSIEQHQYKEMLGKAMDHEKALAWLGSLLGLPTGAS